MLKLLSIAALASAVVLSTAAITPVSAQHRGGAGRYHFTPHYGSRMHVQPRPHYFGRAHLQRPHPLPLRPYHWRHGSNRWTGHPIHWRHASHRPYHWRYGSYGWAYGVPVGVGVGVATYAAAAPAPVCTCLTKDYLDDGSVRFTDTCTKEFAVSLPPAPARRLSNKLPDSLPPGDKGSRSQDREPFAVCGA